MLKNQLSPAQQHLIELMQRINFGRIDGLSVRQGDPVLQPPPKTIRVIKIGAESGPRPESNKADFKLKSHAHTLFAQLASMGDGAICSIEVQYGLPFLITIEEVQG